MQRVESRTCARPGKESKVAGSVQSVGCGCVPLSSLRSHLLLFFASRWWDLRAWTLNCSPCAPGGFETPVLFGKPMLPSFPLCVITVGSSLCFAQILLPPSGVEEEETHLTN